MDKTGKCSAAHSWFKWQTFLKAKRNKLETFLEYLQNEQKINLTSSGNILEISLPKLLDMRDEYSRKSGHKSGHAPDNVAPEAETEAETENNSSSSIGDFQKVYDAGCEKFPELTTKNTSLITQWLNAGCIPELDILPEFVKNSGRTIRSWAYFTGGIMDAKATRETPLPKGQPHEITRSSSAYARQPTKYERSQAAVIAGLQQYEDSLKQQP